MSILPQIDLGIDRPFGHLYDLVGRNTGNLLFTNAVWSQVAGDKKRVNFSFDPGRLNADVDALIIPAANWAGPHVDLANLADRVEQLEIPVVMIGLGAQAASTHETIDIPPGTLRLLKAVAARSKAISVRGRYSEAVLRRHGVKQTVVTGCPSLYHDFTPQSGGCVEPERRGFLLHATRYSMAGATAAAVPALQSAIFKAAYAGGYDLLFQSEPEELEALTSTDGQLEAAPDQWRALTEVYGAGDAASLKRYIAAHGRVFFSVGDWAAASRRYDGVFGTRLHGTIMALNSGAPAVLQVHDSRTREMADFAAIPSVGAEFDLKRRGALQALFASYDASAYEVARRENTLAYAAFLSDNRVSASLAPDVASIG